METWEMARSRLPMSVGGHHHRECLKAEIPPTRSFLVPTRSTFTGQGRAVCFSCTALAIHLKLWGSSRMTFTQRASAFELLSCRVTDGRLRRSSYPVGASGSGSHVQSSRI